MRKENLMAKSATRPVNGPASEGNSNLIEDMISIVYSFSDRLYGSRRAKHIKNKTLKAINESDRA